MEAYEELCRLGIWDFAVDLSGADLPLRSMEDLSLALAPHRNQSFMAFHGLGYKNAPHQMDSNAMKGLILGKFLESDIFNCIPLESRHNEYRLVDPIRYN